MLQNRVRWGDPMAHRVKFIIIVGIRSCITCLLQFLAVKVSIPSLRRRAATTRTAARIHQRGAPQVLRVGAAEGVGGGGKGPYRALGHGRRRRASRRSSRPN